MELKPIEIIEAVQSINADLYEKTGNEYLTLTYTSDGTNEMVEFVGIRLWDYDCDTREYDEDADTYEKIEDCLKRVLREEIAKINELIS